MCPKGLAQNNDQWIDYFKNSGIRLPKDLLNMDSMFTESRDFHLWFFEKEDIQWWRQNPSNERKIRGYKESVFEHAESIVQGTRINMSAYLKLISNSWVIFSRWTKVEPNGQHYVLDNGSPEYYKNLSNRDLLRAVQRENPCWYKLHPVPNLTEDRDTNVMDWCKKVEWWCRWVKRLKPATVEYLNRHLDSYTHQTSSPKLSLLNLVLTICHAITNLCRKSDRWWSHPAGRNLQELKAKLVNKGYSVTRNDGFDDLAWLPVACPILVDYMNEPVLIALSLVTTGDKRIMRKFINEQIGDPNGTPRIPWYTVQKLLVVAYQGHDEDKGDHTFGDDKGLWRILSKEEAEALVVLHGTRLQAAANVMRPNGALTTGKHRAYLHFSAAKGSTTLRQMEAFAKGTAFLILDMGRVTMSYQVYINQVDTITLKRDNGLFERRLPRHFIKYAVNQRGENLRFPAEMRLQNWATYMGADPTESLQRFFRQENFVARAVLMEEPIQANTRRLIEAETAALRASNANSMDTSQRGTIPRNTGDTSVRERASSGEPYCLTGTEMAVKELLPSTNTVTIDCLSPIPLDQCQQFLQVVTRFLNQERTPTKGVEQKIIDIINFTHDHEWRIGQLFKPPVQRDLHADYQKLKPNTIIRAMAEEISAYNGSDMLNHNGASILNLFYQNQLNPLIVCPPGALGTVNPPRLETYVINAARTRNLVSYSPSQLLCQELSEEESKAVINVWVLAFHEWAMTGHRSAAFNPTTGLQDDPDPDEPMLQLEDERAPLAFEENVSKLISVFNNTLSRYTLNITPHQQQSALSLLMSFHKDDVSAAILRIYQGKILGHDND